MDTPHHLTIRLKQVRIQDFHNFGIFKKSCPKNIIYRHQKVLITLWSLLYRNIYPMDSPTIIIVRKSKHFKIMFYIEIKVFVLDAMVNDCTFLSWMSWFI